ncbi:MAG: PD40 domain-containing protein [Anaerohalosphaera sp.]|nr:PD40 domain-containing protein [Anaerohalosphaera sp.]
MVILILTCSAAAAENNSGFDRQAKIRPDYTSTVIPPNIAPLNFTILEDAKSYRVKVYSQTDKDGFEIASNTREIKIPEKKWKTLLNDAAGRNIFFDISIKDDNGNWKNFKTTPNQVAPEPIDGYLAYRFIKPIFNNWENVEIRQRNIETFKDDQIIHGKKIGRGCVNCHTFLNNETQQMAIGFRSKKGVGTFLSINGELQKVDAKWGYTSWHPSGKLAIYSVNKVRQFFHGVSTEVRDVVDLDSAIAYYNVQEQQAHTAPELSDINSQETYPTWTPDGKWLYFCAAPVLWQDRDKMPPKEYDQVKYDLKKISYDIETDTWGKPETVLEAKDTGKSILLPRVTPDGKFLVFSMCDYGCFPVFSPSSDLYIMDLRTGKWENMGNQINSQYSESWHSFSSNGKWMAFSSKRRGGLFTRTFFCYLDDNGEPSKPFILPQEDPLRYDSMLQTFSVPELIKGPVIVSPRQITKTILAEEKIKVNMPLTGATPKVDSAQPWQQVRE